MILLACEYIRFLENKINSIERVNESIESIVEKYEKYENLITDKCEQINALKWKIKDLEINLENRNEKINDIEERLQKSHENIKVLLNINSQMNESLLYNIFVIQ